MSSKIDQEEARKLVGALYKATNAKPMRWRMIIGLSVKQDAVDYAVEMGWILVENGNSVFLTSRVLPWFVPRRHTSTR